MLTGPVAYFGTQEILILAGIVVLLFGGAKLPQLARGMGEGIREFKKSVDGIGGGGSSEGGGDAAPARAAAVAVDETPGVK